MKIFVSVVDSKSKKQTFALREKPILIGRSKKSHIVINDDLTSSQHMMIFMDGNCVYIEDLKSKNGIFLNEVKIFKQRIYIGDKVKIGDTHLYFELKKMDEETIKVLTSQNNTRANSNNLTLELQTYKQKIKKDDSKSGQKDFVKNSKLYAGVAENTEKLSGPIGKKLIILEYGAILIDLVISLLFFVAPFLTLKNILPETYQKIMKPITGPVQLFQGEALYLSGSSLIFCFIIFKLIRSRKKGSIGEKILGLD